MSFRLNESCEPNATLGVQRVFHCFRLEYVRSPLVLPLHLHSKTRINRQHSEYDTNAIVFGVILQYFHTRNKMLNDLYNSSRISKCENKQKRSQRCELSYRMCTFDRFFLSYNYIKLSTYLPLFYIIQFSQAHTKPILTKTK